MNNNSKGFTLVELMAVIIILVFICILSIFAVNRYTENSKINSFISEANVFTKAAGTKYFADKSIDPSLRSDLYGGTKEGKLCYSITDDLLSKYVNKDDSYKYHGSVEVCYGSECNYQYKIWLSDGKAFFINGKSKVLTEDDVDYKSTVKNFDSCGFDTIGSHAVSPTVAEFNYSGEENVFTVLKDGVYVLEAWGAQGGNSGSALGGYGAYAYTEMTFKKGDKIYINVGQEGCLPCKSIDDESCRHSYNGGYKGSTTIAGGGGATSFASQSGQLFENIPKSSFYLVAGGGGGAITSLNQYDGFNKVKNGGAYCNFTNTSTTACQSGVFASSIRNNTYYGAGGGIYISSRTDGIFASGGQSYAHHRDSKNSKLYCYNCYVDTANVETHKSYVNAKKSTIPTPTYSKAGNGFARISLKGDNFITYDLNGGTLLTPNKEMYLSSDEPFTLNNPVKNGYNFTGWTLNGSLTPVLNVTIDTSIPGNKNFTANYTPINYTISYNLNGGSLSSGESNRTTYNVETETFTLKNPVRSGYVFKGWRVDGSTEILPSVTISKGSTENRAFTAVFLENEYVDVTFDYNMGTYTIPSGGTFLDSGIYANFNEDFKIDMNINFPSSGKRYLIIGNYDKSPQMNIEINASNKLRVYQNGDRSISSASVPIGENVDFSFTYTASGKEFTSSITGTTTATAAGTFTNSGTSSTSLRLGQDYRGGSTFTTYTINSFKLTKRYLANDAINDVPNGVVKNGSTFLGWYTQPSGGVQVNNGDLLGNTSVTYYAHWS